MNIEQAFSRAANFVALCPILEQANIQLSFWGHHTVTVNGYEGGLDLENFTDRCKSVLYHGSRREERIFIYKQIELLRLSGKELVENSNCLTKLFVLALRFFRWFQDWYYCICHVTNCGIGTDFSDEDEMEMARRELYKIG